jgi:hypothetical protein
MNQKSQSRQTGEENCTAHFTNPRESKVGSFRRKRPKSQARTRRLRAKKMEFAVASGEPDKQDSGQQAANSETN